MGVRVLLDTHVVLWALTEPDRLSNRSRELLEDAHTEIVVSAASAWEVATKHRLGKLPNAGDLVDSFAEYLRELRAVDLPIRTEHALLAGRLAVEHRDPFDRMLAAQALCEQIPLISQDASFAAFPVSIVW